MATTPISFLMQTLRRAVVGDLGFRPVHRPTGIKVYVSLTTTPRRIRNIDRCLESLVMQTLTRERIFLCVPTRYERYSGAVEIPESLSRFGKRLQIVSCPEDY